MKVTRERVLELLRYEPETGRFYWKVDRRNQVKVGDRAGRVHAKGYRYIRIDGRSYRAHRLVWLVETGEWPKHQLDHVNRDCDDNRFVNLRSATNSENLQNRNKRLDNSSGRVGVSWMVSRQKWHAQIQVSGKKHHLGFFLNIEDAAEAYASAKARLHTFHPEVAT